MPFSPVERFKSIGQAQKKFLNPSIWIYRSKFPVGLKDAGNSCGSLHQFARLA